MEFSLWSLKYVLTTMPAVLKGLYFSTALKFCSVSLTGTQMYGSLSLGTGETPTVLVCIGMEGNPPLCLS